MSVRSRIDAFESLSKEEADNKNEPNTKKKFHYPGSNRRSTTEHAQTNNFSSNKAPRTQGIADFESDLREVWSVRKNIHHQGGNSKQPQPANSTSLPSMQTAGQYSRHGAIAAQQSYGASVLPKSNKEPANKSLTSGCAHNDDFSFETNRTPLQEHNSPWNVKKSNYSYNSPEVANKRPLGSPHTANGVPSPPTAKRKPNLGEAAVVRSTKVNDVMFPPSRRKPDEKVNYAKRMANSYLRSVGIGEFTPKTETEKLPQRQSTRWKNSESEDDFNF